MSAGARLWCIKGLCDRQTEPQSMADPFHLYCLVPRHVTDDVVPMASVRLTQSWHRHCSRCEQVCPPASERAFSAGLRPAIRPSLRTMRLPGPHATTNEPTAPEPQAA